MKQFGIDVSRWQGDFDFAKSKKEGVQFVIVKAGGGDDGLYVDSKYEKNYSAVKKNGLPVGAYWFSKALSVADAEKEADYFYNNCLKGKKFELPVYMDVENKTQLKIGKRKLTDVIKAFCERLEANGFWVGIYSSVSYFSGYMYDKELKCYAHWVAQYNSVCQYSGDYGIWQFGGSTNYIRTNKVAGVVCDQNYMYVDYPAKIKAAGKNGYTKSAAKEETKQEAKYTTYVVKSGDSWWGIAAKKMGSGLNCKALAKYNGKTVMSVIHPGDILKIPK